MKKRILSFLAAAVLLLLLPLSLAGADGASYWDAAANAYLYDEPHYGIVICRQMNVRDRASTSGKAYGSIKNGQPVTILGVTEKGDFYVLDLASCGFAGYSTGDYGYAKSSLIKMDPEFIATTKLTNLYATPWSTEKKNGEQTNRFFLIIDQHNEWFAVQAMEGSPGSAFIRSRDIGQYTPQYQSMYVVTWDTALYDDNMNHIQNVKRFTTGSMLDASGDYSLVVFNEGTASELQAWILSQYLAPIFN